MNFNLKLKILRVKIRTKISCEGRSVGQESLGSRDGRDPSHRVI